MSTSLGEKLKQARINKGLKQSDVAIALDVKNTTISNWEKNVSKPDADMIGALCGLLSISPNVLFEYPNIELALSSNEKEYIKKYRALDKHGKRAVASVLDAEYDRYLQTESAKKTDKGTPIHKPEAYRTSRKYPANVVVLEDYSDAPEDTTTIPVYDAGASAGTGIFLDSDYYDVIAIADNYTNRKANFAVWVDGHSMEPKFNDGDLVLVRQQPQVDIGEIGIFIVNGEGFIKKLGEGELISLNPDYENIRLNEWDDISCKGRVLGKL